MVKIIHLLITFGAFLAIDLVWLGVVAKNFYREELGHLMRTSPNWIAAMAFYLLYIIGLFVLIIYPNLSEGGLKVFLLGAFFGVIAYATFDLTALSVLKDWPIKMTVVDIIWGGVITGTVAWIGLQVANWIK